MILVRCIQFFWVKVYFGVCFVFSCSFFIFFGELFVCEFCGHSMRVYTWSRFDPRSEVFLCFVLCTMVFSMGISFRCKLIYSL